MLTCQADPVIVLADVEKQRVIATVSIAFERKFIRNCGKVRGDNWFVPYCSV